MNGNSRKILITGGSGFIGKFTALELRRAGHTVHIVDHRFNGEAAISSPSNVFHQCDINDERLLHQILVKNEIELIVHLAGPHSVPQSKTDPYGYFHQIVDPTRGILRAMENSPVEGVVFASSSRVYGNYPHHSAIAETVPCHPLDPYGAAKLYAEEVFLSAAENFNVGILRFFNVSGAHPSGTMGRDQITTPHLIKVLCNIALGKQQQFRLHAQGLPTPDGSSVRDFVHVMDAARAVRLTAESILSEKENLTLNIGSGVGTSIYEMIRSAEEIFKCRIPVVLDSEIREDVPTLIADISQAKRLLGWAPTYSTREIIEHAWAWAQFREKASDVALQRAPTPSLEL